MKMQSSNLKKKRPLKRLSLRAVRWLRPWFHTAWRETAGGLSFRFAPLAVVLVLTRAALL